MALDRKPRNKKKIKGEEKVSVSPYAFAFRVEYLLLRLHCYFQVYFLGTKFKQEEEKVALRESFAFGALQVSARIYQAVRDGGHLQMHSQQLRPPYI